MLQLQGTPRPVSQALCLALAHLPGVFAEAQGCSAPLGQDMG